MIKLEMPIYDWALICDNYTSYSYCNKDAYDFLVILCERTKVHVKEVAKLTHETMVSVDLSDEEFIKFYDEFWWTLHEAGLCCFVDRDNDIMKKIYYLLEDIKTNNKLTSQFDGNKWVSDIINELPFEECCEDLQARIGMNKLLREMYEKQEAEKAYFTQ